MKMAEPISKSDRLGQIMARPEFEDISQFIIPTLAGQPTEMTKQTKIGALDQIAGQETWHVDDLVDGLNYVSDLAAQGIPVHYDYWSEEEKAKDPRKEGTGLLHFPVKNKGPFVLVCPGGCYFMVASFVEGFPTVMELNRLGYSAFVLTYRVGRENPWPAPIEDLQQALHFILSHADLFNVETENYAVVGFSAGGHLAGSFGAPAYGYQKWNLPKPGALILAYPVTKFDNMTQLHRQCRDILLGENPTEEQIHSIDVVRNAEDDYPPTYILHCQDDDLIHFENGEMLANRLKDLNVPCHFKAAPAGGHGIALGTGTTAQGWLVEAVQFWQSQSQEEIEDA